jgi:RimK family alpha-L-glutamate ligase
LGIPVANSSSSIKIGRDKFHTHQIWFNKSIPTPKTMLFNTFPINIDFVEREIGFPCVIKPNPGSYGDGIHVCKTRQEFEDHMHMLHHVTIGKTLMIQELIPDHAGTDLRVFVVNGKVLGAMRRVSPRINDIRVLVHGEYGFRENYKLTDEIEDIALRAVNAIGLEIAGVDLLFSNDGFKVCEVNVCPGFGTFEKYCEINVAKAIVDFVKSRM